MVKKGKFSEPSLLILISLAETNRHGYALWKIFKRRMIFN